MKPSDVSPSDVSQVNGDRPDSDRPDSDRPDRAQAYGGHAQDERVLRPEERDVRELVRAATRGSSADAELRAVIASLGEPTVVAVLLLLGRYAAHALMSCVRRLGPPVSLDPPLSATPTASSQRRTT